MTTFSLNGFTIQRDGTPAENVIAVNPTTLSVVIRGDVFNYRIETPPTNDDPLPIIGANNPSDILSLQLDGALAPENREVSLGFITTPEGTHVIFAVFDPDTETDYIFVFGGDPLTFPTTPAEANALDASISGAGTATGAFAPNTDIPLSSLANVTTSEDDLMNGQNTDDLIEGGIGNDSIDGLAGNDTLLGQDGNDDIIGGPGADSISGGNGNDVADGDDGNDTILGGDGDDDLAGDAGSDQVEGNAGNDTLFGDGGSDTLRGGTGDDRLEGGNQNDLVSGGADNDILVGGNGDDTLQGGNGGDVLDGGPGNDLVITGENDPLALGDGVQGGTGNDTIDFSGIVDGFVTVSYGDLAGPIIVNIDGAANTGTVDKGADGTDTFLNVENPLFAGFANGGLGILGTGGDDIFNVAPDGQQWISVRGDGGSDTYNISGSGLVRIDLRGPAVNVNIANGTIVQDGVNSTINGTPFEIRSGDAADTLIGADADDSFRPGGGNNVIDGGAGFDRLRFDNGEMDTGIDGNLATGTITGSANGQAFTTTTDNIEFLRGTGLDDTITGDANANRLQGRDGNDTITGGGGDDTIEGDGGNDTAMLGVARADATVSQVNGSIQLVSTEGTDLFSGIETFLFSDGAVSASDLLDGSGIEGEKVLGTDGDDTLDGSINDDTISGGDGNDSIDGGGGDDQIAASDGNDFVDAGAGDDEVGGGPGDDTIDGGGGNDILGSGQGDDNATGNDGNDIVNGGAGNDFLFGGAGNDTMGAGLGQDTVVGEGGDDSLGGGAGRDELNGREGNDEIGAGEGDDTVDGGAGNDFVAGGGRNDVVDGGAGDDRINGGDGDDTMTGGDGADVFIYNFFKAGDMDIITDFEDGVDSFLIRIISTIDGTPNIDNGGNGIQGFVDDLNITQTAAGAQMNVDGHLILLQNVAAADLTVDDFAFI